MKNAAMIVVVAAALPLAINSLFVRSQDSSFEVPKVVCEGGDDDTLSAYDKVYLKSYYEATASKVVEGSDSLKAAISGLDANNDGVLDCSELAELKNLMESDGDQKDFVEQVTSKAEKIEVQRLDNANSDAVAESHMKMLKSEDENAASTGVDASDDKCTPQCTWTCGSAKCDEVCKPDCQSAQCQTRCTGMSTSGCRMKCGAPRCQQICSSPKCKMKDCPVCKTQCGKPMCKIVCPSGTQNCRDVCETPACAWKCHKPKVCPRPACTLKCDSPRDCKGTKYKELPPVKKGEMVVQTFELPKKPAFLQLQGAGMRTMSVSVARAVSVPGSGELRMEHSVVSLPVDMEA